MLVTADFAFMPRTLLCTRAFKMFRMFKIHIYYINIKLHLYVFKIFRMFKIHILYAKLFQTDTHNGTNISFILAVEHIEQITHNRSRNVYH